MSGKLDRTELAGIRWLIGQVMVLISLAGGYTIDLGASGLLSASLLLVLVVSAFPGLITLVPGLVWRIAPFGLLVLIATDFVLSGGDVLPPLFRMIVILTLYRSLQGRTPREDMQLLLLTLFLILITGVLSLEITFAMQMLVYAPLAMGLLFAANLSASHSAPAAGQDASFYRSGWRRLARRLRERVDRRTLAAGVVLFLMTTSMALVLFIFLPRFDIGAALPFPRLQTAQSLTGFSDHVRYGDVVSILNDDAIAMRVDVSMESPPARPYWRMVVLDAYYDGGFMVSPAVARDRRTLSNYRFDFDNPGASGGAANAVWTLYMEGGISAYLPAGDSFSTLRFKNRIDLQLHDLTRVMKTNETNANTLSLRYEGLGFGGVLPMATADLDLTGMKPMLVDTSDPAYLKDVSYPATLMVVPGGRDNQRILDAALRRIGPPRKSQPAEFAGRAVAYLQSGRGYSLETRIPDGPAEGVLRWIESGQAGHCELYAGALVLISRYAGIPARLVTGYAGGDWNGYENYFMVRNRNAHAWVEVFDRDAGWIRVDPTPGYLDDPGSVSNALAGGGLLLDRTWQAYLDSLKVLWFRRVIQFDSADQALMADSVKEIGLFSFDWLKKRAESLRDKLNRDWEAGIRRGDWSQAVRDLAPPAGIVAGLGVMILLLQRLRRRGSREALLRKRAGQLLVALSGKLPETSSAHGRLLLVRYGPAQAWPADTEAFLRRLRRRPRRAIREASRP